MYKIKGKNTLFNPVEQIFTNRNIPVEDIEWFKNPTPYEYDGGLMKNMDVGASLLLSHIEKDSHIHVQIDQDLDGLTSSAILINYLKRVFPDINVTWTNHRRMKHGIDLQLVPDTANLLIVPDAGSNSFEEHQALHNKGVDVLVIDHHEASHYSEWATVINPQLDDYPNKQLSGAGVVYKFIQQIDKELGLSYHTDYLDLCSFGMIGDAMEISSKETYWLAKQGFSNVKNEFLKELVKENVDSGEELNPTILAFKCNPKVNSLIRVGTEEELDGLMKAFLEHQEVTINPRLRRKDKSETWTRRMTRICNNTYARQRRLRDAILEELEEKIESERLHDNRFIVVEIEGDFEKNMSGYIAISLVNKYRKPVLVLNENEDGDLGGSLRGYDPLMLDTKDFLNSLDLFDVAEGHQQACGLEISKENFQKLNKAINDRLQFSKEEESYLVDLAMDSRSLTKSFIESMESYNNLWGKGIEPPSYAITSAKVRVNDIQLIGKSENVLKFTLNNIEYVQFTTSKEMKELVQNESGETVELDLIGTTGINSWRGNRTPQFVIDAIQIKGVEKSPLFEF